MEDNMRPALTLLEACSCRHRSTESAGAEQVSQFEMLVGGCADPSDHENHVAALQMFDHAKRAPDSGCYLTVAVPRRFFAVRFLLRWSIE